MLLFTVLCSGHLGSPAGRSSVVVKPPTLEWTLLPWSSYWRMDGDWTNQPTQHALMKCKHVASQICIMKLLVATAKSKVKKGTHYTINMPLLQNVNTTIMHEPGIKYCCSLSLASSSIESFSQCTASGKKLGWCPGIRR